MDINKILFNFVYFVSRNDHSNKYGILFLNDDQDRKLAGNYCRIGEKSKVKFSDARKKDLK